MTETRADTSGQAHVLLDVGDDAGALVIFTGPELDGSEIEVDHPGAPAHRTHVEVHPRHLRGRVTYAAVFPTLGAGEYVVHGRPGTDAVPVTVAGGVVTELHWD